jgi:hypothetical protein
MFNLLFILATGFTLLIPRSSVYASECTISPSQVQRGIPTLITYTMTQANWGLNNITVTKGTEFNNVTNVSCLGTCDNTSTHIISWADGVPNWIKFNYTGQSNGLKTLQGDTPNTTCYASFTVIDPLPTPTSTPSILTSTLTQSASGAGSLIRSIIPIAIPALIATALVPFVIMIFRRIVHV